ncbi:hypothetical protein DFJ74DRAFT_693664 [Hyaloraphidium curvatum]|nr:hypothetical protein DFJ74DRAFT_693664 [Hyaloraphidium curvatum]
MSGLGSAAPLLGAAAAGLVGAAFLDSRVGLSKDLKAIRRGNQCLQRLNDVCVNTGRWNISYRWSESVDRVPNSVAFRTPGIEEGDTGRAWTYAEADNEINRVARWLKETVGVKKGDRVALVFENTPQYLFILLAIQKLGAVHVPQNFNLRGTGFIHCVGIVTPVAIIFEDRMSHIFDAEVCKAMNDRNVKMFCYDFTDGSARIDVPVEEVVSEVSLAKKYPGRVEPPSEEDGRKLSGPTDPAQILYTSGTTGLPKGTMHQQFALNRLAVVFPIQFDVFSKDDVTIIVLPMYHSQGLVSFYGTMCSGGTVIPVRKFSARRFWSDVVRLNVTTFIYLGEILRYLLAVPPYPAEREHKVRKIFGAGMRADLFVPLRDRFGIQRVTEFYAASDGTAFTSFEWHGEKEGIGAVGFRGRLMERMVPGTIIVKYDPIEEKLIRDPKTGLCIPCARGEPGEALGPYDPSLPGQPFYWNNPEAIEKKIYRDVLQKGDMWWRSGDLLVQDSKGYFFFMDRIGDTFRWKGENVSTLEVGNAMTEFHPLQEANVYGVKFPGIEDGRAGMAMVTIREEYAGKDVDQLMRDLGKHTVKMLPRYAVPIFVRVAPEIEITGTFKHRKVEYQKEGVDPAVVSDKLFWMPPGSNEYVPFGKAEYATLGQLKGKL